MKTNKAFLLATVLLCAVALLAVSCRYANDASDTLYKETKASTLLKKYEYYKDVSAQLDAKMASIHILENTIIDLKTQYGETPRKEWARENREDYNLKNEELAGLKLSFNTLAADYNAQMSKLNWAFCNVGSLPEGAETPLPKNYKPYLTQ